MAKLCKTAETKRPYWLGLALTLGILACLAPENGGAQTRPEAREGMVDARATQGLAYTSGGVGIDERTRMAAENSDYNLKLVFANTRGEYLDEVNVWIKDQHGKDIVRSTTDGPWFYVKLPPGKYSVDVSFDGKTKQVRDLNLANAQVVRFFHWS